MENKKKKAGYIWTTSEKPWSASKPLPRRTMSDEAYHTLKRIVKKCEKLIKAYEKKLAQREKEREKALNR